MDATHAFNVLEEVALHLCQKGSMKERLLAALLDTQFVTVRKTDLDNDQHARFKMIHEKLTQVPAQGLEASFVASVGAMTEEEAEFVALGLAEMALRVAHQQGKSSQ